MCVCVRVLVCLFCEQKPGAQPPMQSSWPPVLIFDLCPKRHAEKQ